MKTIAFILLTIVSVNCFGQKSFGHIQSKIEIPKQEDKFDFVGSGAFLLVGSTAALLFTKHDAQQVRKPIYVLMAAGYTMMITGAASKDKRMKPKEL